MNYWQRPRIRRNAFAIWQRNVLVWKRLLGPAMVLNFGEPTLYLLGLGYGLGFFIGEMGDMPYIAFLASGIVASSAMTTASFEGMYSVFTRMVPQRTYEAIMATPTDIDDILAGEMMWCATKAVISASAIECRLPPTHEIRQLGSARYRATSSGAASSARPAGWRLAPPTSLRSSNEGGVP